MQIYEKAIEDYAKRRKEEFDWELKHDIEEFILQVEQMTADGKCRNIKCDYCFATLKYQPFKEHESVLVFGNTKKSVRYFPQMEDRHGSEIGKTRKAARQVSIEKCQTEVYGGIKHDRDTRNYGELRYPSSVQIFNNRNPRDRGLHPTQKPVAIMEYLVRTYTSEGDVVLDNCMGSGTTGVACVNTGRRFVGIELENKYFNIAKKRISEVTECLFSH